MQVSLGRPALLTITGLGLAKHCENVIAADYVHWTVCWSALRP